ncbi:unnamed protein product [Chondrus crispus]|uniref:Uncharacterized protein n=1 Tax=Chondrus crispus TaxID=2769 RepID=R7Q344_CHOCR|nr:unnamed protein product [Chondrus crispus]CDF32323.1 unnamed protein product [Chondrus crispus]|eukprot:XP_005711988.1 unnamed protein product [Chondrus crispus]
MGHEESRSMGQLRYIFPFAPCGIAKIGTKEMRCDTFTLGIICDVGGPLLYVSAF